MKIINKLLLLSVLILSLSCAKDPMTTTQTDNSNFQVALLFVHEDCRVYRFSDAGGYKYFTNCTETISEETRSCGKNCVRTEAINISNKRKQND